MPHVAQLLSTPRKYAKLGLQRYGFHGLSYAYVFQRFAEIAGADAAQGRIIMAHLGSGASLAAVHRGKPVDTTMGFSPASGIMMSSRSGDLDPGVAGYLHRQAGMNFDEYDRMVHFESGLKGVSGTSADMLTLLKREPNDDAAHDAIELFCYDVKKAIGSLAATLGGLDSLIFTGGIGEPAAGIRSRICSGLEFLGVNLNSERNAANAERISADGARAGVHVIPTDEALTIYQQTLQATLRGDNHDEQR
jgi:acetate kinase